MKTTMALLRKKAFLFCLVAALVCSLLIESTEGGNKDKDAKPKPASPHGVQTQDLNVGSIEKKCKNGVPNSACSDGLMAAAAEDDRDDDDDDDDGDAAFVEDKTVKTVVLGH